MADKVQTAMLDILKSIQVELADHRKLFHKIDAHLERIETLHRKDRVNSAGMLVIMRSTAGGFDQRIADVAAY